MWYNWYEYKRMTGKMIEWQLSIINYYLDYLSSISSIWHKMIGGRYEKNGFR